MKSLRGYHEETMQNKNSQLRKEFQRTLEAQEKEP